jgi:hypothetical protein
VPSRSDSIKTVIAEDIHFSGSLSKNGTAFADV